LNFRGFAQESLIGPKNNQKLSKNFKNLSKMLEFDKFSGFLLTIHWKKYRKIFKKWQNIVNNNQK
jgi:hypothetical protein